MGRFIALLRGINVGGKNRIKMAELAAAFEASGFSGIQTYIQSGNVVFSASQGSPETLQKSITALIHKHFSLSVPVVVRKAKSFDALLKNTPFKNRRGLDPKKLCVVFLDGTPTTAALALLKPYALKTNDEFIAIGTELFMYSPRGFADTKMTNNIIEKHLGMIATTRNWQTVETLAGLARE